MWICGFGDLLELLDLGIWGICEFVYLELASH